MKKSKNQICLTLALLIGLSINSSCKKDPSVIDRTDKEIVPVINFTPARTSAELMNLRADESANIIRTIGEFENVLLSNHTPLNKLSNDQLKDFKASLVVRENVGIVSLNYGVLKGALSYDDFAITLSLFGLDVKQGYWGLSNDPAIEAKLKPSSQTNPSFDEVGGVVVGTDYEGYLCSDKKNCSKAKDYICMSGC